MKDDKLIDGGAPGSQPVAVGPVGDEVDMADSGVQSQYLQLPTRFDMQIQTMPEPKKMKEKNI